MGYKQSFGPLHPVFSISSLGQMKPEGVVVCIDISVDVGVVAVLEVDDDGCEVGDDGIELVVIVVDCVGFSVGVGVVAVFAFDEDGCEVVDDGKGLGVDVAG